MYELSVVIYSISRFVVRVSPMVIAYHICMTYICGMLSPLGKLVETHSFKDTVQSVYYISHLCCI